MENGYQDYGQEGTAYQGMGADGGYTGNPFADMDYGLCKRCRRRSIDRSENPESVLCHDCREELIRLKVPPIFYVVGLAVMLMVAFTMVTSVGGFRNFGTYNKSQDVAGEGYVLSTMNGLLEILEENPDNKEVAVKLVDMGMKYSYYDYAAYTIDNYLVGKEVSDYEYDKLNGYINKLEAYYATYDLFNEVWDDVFGEDPEAEDIPEALDEFNRELSRFVRQPGYDQALLFYYLGYMSVNTEESIAYLEECLKLNPYIYEAQAQLATYYRRQGKLDRARRQLEEIYKVNKEDSSILRSYATLELVEGNLEEGLTYAELAYEFNYDGEYVIDTYIVALAANGRMEEAEQLLENYEAEYVFDDDLYAYLNGEMTLEDYYIGE